MEKTVQCSEVGQESGLGVQMSVQMTLTKGKNMSENYTFGSHLHPGGKLGNEKIHLDSIFFKVPHTQG